MNPLHWNIAPLAPLAPLLLTTGAFTIWLWGRYTVGRSGKPVAVLASMLSACAALAVFAWQQSLNESRFLAGPNWMIVPGQSPTGISFSFHLDNLSLSALALVTVLGALTIVLEPRDVERGRHVWRLLALAGAQMVLLTDNLVVLLAFWVLSQVAVWKQSAHGMSARGGFAPPPLLALAADLPLLLGIVVCWLNFSSHFNSLQLSKLANPATLVPLGPNQQAAMVLLGYCVLCVAYARCLQFPFHVPAPPIDEEDACPHGRTDTATALVTVIVPTGLYLLFRFQPWFVAEPGSRTLLTGAGCLSALLWGGMAVTQPTLSRSVVSFLAGSVGLVFVGVGCGVPSLTLASLLIAGAWAILQLDDPVRRFPVRAAAVIAVVVCSGAFGQEAVLNSSWPSLTPSIQPAPSAAVEAGPSDSTALAPDGGLVGPVLPGVIMLAHLLLSLALFRGVFRHAQPGAQLTADDSPAGKPADPSSSPYSPSTILVLIVGLGAAPLLAWAARSNGDEWPPGTPGVLALLMFVALLLAWVLYSRPSDWPARIENASGGLATLSRRSFYAADAIQLAWVMPWTLLAWLAGTSDRTFQERIAQRQRDVGTSARRILNESAGEGPLRAFVITLILGAAVVIVLLNQG